MTITGITEPGVGRTLTFTLPWAALQADNHKHTVARGRLILAKPYREAKRHSQLLLMGQTKGRKPLNGPLRLHATLHEPDKRRRDVVNYAKMVQDALTGIAYADDAQLCEVTWSRGKLDKANPRVDLWLGELIAWY